MKQVEENVAANLEKSSALLALFKEMNMKVDALSMDCKATDSVLAMTEDDANALRNAAVALAETMSYDDAAKLDHEVDDVMKRSIEVAKALNKMADYVQKEMIPKLLLVISSAHSQVQATQVRTSHHQ